MPLYNNITRQSLVQQPYLPGATRYLNRTTGKLTPCQPWVCKDVSAAMRYAARCCADADSLLALAHALLVCSIILSQHMPSA